MPFTITYLDSEREPITEQQALASDKYEKVYLDNNVKKKVEYIENDTISYLDYYINSGEDETTIINQLDKLGIKEITIIQNRPFGAYIIEQQRTFFNKVYGAKDESLYDKNGNQLCWQIYYIETDEVDYTETEKYFYGEDNEVFAEFGYHSDGTLRFVSGGIVVSEGYIYKDLGAVFHEETLDPKQVQEHFPNLLIDHPYYANATFLPD